MMLALAFTLGLMGAFPSSGLYNPAAAGAPSHIGLSLSIYDMTAANGPVCINWLKCGQYNINGNSPTLLDANNYPNGTIASSMSWNPLFQPALSYYSGTWEEGWTGTFKLQNDSSITVTSDPQGCNQGSGLFSGTNCDVTFSYASNPSGVVTIPSGTYSGISGVFLIRSTDKTAYLAGQLYTPEWINALKALNPQFLRTMQISFPNQPIQNEASWADRLPTAAASWNPAHGYWILNDWAGADATHTDNYVLSSYPNMPGSWTDSELFQFNVTHGSNAALMISAAANDGGNSEVQLTVSSTSALTTGQQVLVVNCVTSQPPAPYTITVESGTTLDLQGTTYSSIWSNCPQAGGGASGFIATTTINVGSRGAKFVLPWNAGSWAFGGGSAGISGNGTAVYDATLGILIYSNDGIYGGPPPEAQAAMANQANAPLWFNTQPFWHASDVTSAINYFNSNLNSDLYLEVDNENWNGSYQAVLWQNRGFALGWAYSSNQATYSYIGLLNRQLLGAATAAWTKGSIHLHRVNAAQAFGSPSNFSTYQFQGQSLNGATYPLYCAYVGGSYSGGVCTGDPGYNSSPNRPQDYSDDYSIATYFAGAQTNGNNGTLSQLSGVITAGTQYASGDTTDAYAFVDNDIRSGTFNGGSSCGSTPTTIACLQSADFPGWNTQASTDGKGLIAYEGGFDAKGPSAAYLTSIGDGSASTDATNINNMLIGYRSSALFYSTYIYWNTTWFSNSKVVGNSNLSVNAPNPSINANNWALINALYPLSAYQSYNAFGAINFLLNRDLDPASNDNAPAFLNKAA